MGWPFEPPWGKVRADHLEVPNWVAPQGKVILASIYLNLVAALRLHQFYQVHTFQMYPLHHQMLLLLFRGHILVNLSAMKPCAVIKGMSGWTIIGPA